MGKSSIIVCDSSPLINLAYVDSLHLLTRITTYPEELKIIVPDLVLNEIKDRKTKDQLDDLIKQKKILIYGIDREKHKQRVVSITTKMALEYFTKSRESLVPKHHETEAYVMCFGEELGAEFLLLEEKAAVTIARNELGMSCLSHLDIIEKCVKNNSISKHDALMMITRLIEEKGQKYKNARSLLNRYRG